MCIQPSPTLIFTAYVINTLIRTIGHFLSRKILWEDVLKTSVTTEGEDEGTFTLHYIKNLGYVPQDKKGIRWKHTEKTIRAEQGREHVTLKLRENIEELLSEKGNIQQDIRH